MLAFRDLLAKDHARHCSPQSSRSVVVVSKVDELFEYVEEDEEEEEDPQACQTKPPVYKRWCDADRQKHHFRTKAIMQVEGKGGISKAKKRGLQTATQPAYPGSMGFVPPKTPVCLRSSRICWMPSPGWRRKSAYPEREAGAQPLQRLKRTSLPAWAPRKKKTAPAAQNLWRCWSRNREQVE